MNLLPRSVATLTLAVSAVPGVAPLAAHMHAQHLPHHATVHAVRPVAGHPAAHAVHPAVHPAQHAKPHALVRPAIHSAAHPAAHPAVHVALHPIVVEAKLPGADRPLVHPAAAHLATKGGVRKTALPATAEPGGWTRQDSDSPLVLGAATFAVDSLSQTFGRHYVVEHITDAETQVVEGTNVKIKLRIAQLKGEILGARKDCTVEVWSRIGAKPADKLTSFDCQSVDTAVPAAQKAVPGAVKAVPGAVKQHAAKPAADRKRDAAKAPKADKKAEAAAKTVAEHKVLA
jgi:hypothetical protein